MEWRNSYLDLILVPMGVLFSMVYHGWLWNKVRTQPYRTTLGTNTAGRRLWVLAMMKDNEKKNILAVQTLRNAIMGSTLMATTSILLCSGLAAAISSTYSVKKPLNDPLLGGHGELLVGLKYVAILLVFLFAFLCYSFSICSINQVNFLINVPLGIDNDIPLSPEYICEILERGFLLNAVGNRLFYVGLQLLMWIFGPVLVFLCSAVMVPIMYNLDIIYREPKAEKKISRGSEFALV